MTEQQETRLYFILARLVTRQTITDQAVTEIQQIIATDIASIRAERDTALSEASMLRKSVEMTQRLVEAKDGLIMQQNKDLIILQNRIRFLEEQIPSSPVNTPIP